MRPSQFSSFLSRAILVTMRDPNWTLEQGDGGSRPSLRHADVTPKVLVEPLLIVRPAARADVTLHRRLLAIVRDDDVCRRLITVPGVGPVAR